MGVPPTPKNPYDADTAAAGGASTTDSSTVDIWGLGNYGKQTVVFGAAEKRRTGFSGYYKIPGADREGGQSGTLAPGTQGPVVTAPGAAIPTPGDALAVQSTIADLMKYFAGLPYSPSGQAEFEKYQRLLFGAGYYGSAKPSDVAWGSWSGSSGAFKDALISAAQAKAGGAPVSFEEFLTKAANDKAAAGKKYAQGQPGSVAEITDPKAQAAVLQQTAQTVLGKNLSKDEVDHFVSEYTANQKAYYSRKYSDNPAPDSLDLIQGAPDLQTEAQDFVQQQHGTEIAGNSMSDYLGVIQNLLGGSG